MVREKSGKKRENSSDVLIQKGVEDRRREGRGEKWGKRGGEGKQVSIASDISHPFNISCERYSRRSVLRSRTERVTLLRRDDAFGNDTK